MASYTVNLNITSDKFPEIGTPMNPKTASEVTKSGTKMSRDDRGEYNNYISEIGLSDMSMSMGGDKFCPSCDKNKMEIRLDYEKETLKTFKFLGMDIDENFNAIIKVGQGHVVVGSLIDRAEIIDCYKKIFGDDRYIRNINGDTIRKVVTGLKTGLTYDIVWVKSINVDRYNGEALDILNKIMGLVKGYVEEQKTGSFEFKSVMLNLIHSKNIELSNAISEESVEDICRKILRSLFYYWKGLVLNYEKEYTMLCSLDIWGDMNRRLTGRDTFDTRMKNCMEVIDNSSKNKEDMVVSFNGISKNRSLSDPNIVRDGCRYGIAEIENWIKTGNIAGVDRDNIRDMLMGMIDFEDYDDVYSLSNDELQAISVIDSLKYIDDDAELCKESYDMNDPEQRGLFVKSVIKSYRRNFKEFKPAEDYDVTEALAEMVERGDITSNPKLVSQSTTTDDEGNTVVTSSEEDIEVNINKTQIVKILKLIYKSTQQIVKGF